MKEQYEIYTDASYDCKNKIGTYAIIIMKGKKIIKTIAKKCNTEAKSSTECEIFAVYQAINYILSALIKNDIQQKFYINTDCEIAKDFFVENKKIKIFKDNVNLIETIKKSYKSLKNKLANNESFSIKWIPREANKVAHKYSYSILKTLKKNKLKKDNIIIKKDSFLELLHNFNLNQYKVISYLLDIVNEENLILKTQKEIAITLEISISSINKIFKKLIKLNILQKVQNGKYILLI